MIYRTRTAVVTGASGRLGRLLCLEFLRRGVPVAGLVRTEAEGEGLIAELPGMTAIACDLLSERAVVAAFDAVAREVGPMGHCIHAVGSWGMKPFAETSLAEWNALVDTNLTSAFLVFREATRHFLVSGGGFLVGVASRQGVEGGAASQGAYSAAKGGLVRLVEAIAAEHAGHEIVARTVAPSTILFDGLSAPGIPAHALAELCVHLAMPGHPAENGSVIRAYGSAA